MICICDNPAGTIEYALGACLGFSNVQFGRSQIRRSSSAADRGNPKIHATVIGPGGQGRYERKEHIF
jgi:hypothetical protein